MYDRHRSTLTSRKKSWLKCWAARSHDFPVRHREVLALRMNFDPKDIQDADVVILAIDAAIDKMDRFTGKSD